jgi:hypothetical protein
MVDACDPRVRADSERTGGVPTVATGGIRKDPDRQSRDGEAASVSKRQVPANGPGTRKRVIILIDGLDVRVLSEDGALLRHFTLDPTRTYHALNFMRLRRL